MLRVNPKQIAPLWSPDFLVRSRKREKSDAPAPARTQFDGLGDREYQIFLLLVKGHSLTCIAQQLNLSVKTVSTHKTNILDKMGMSSTAELVSYAIRHDLGEG
ncbi:MAG: LuxR C-terminal-related transcriptional regulator [Zoogloeaceae bacterium]|nr:LuxR C-terminal-related transcriptional regulator [Zoogloeaceae bacterium]